MSVLCESKKYMVTSDYEIVTLTVKNTHEKIQIGDFYGDPEGAIISADEKFCVMYGCGIIVYFLKKPFENYQYNSKTPQWKEWGRTNANNSVWIENIKLLDKQCIEIESENGIFKKINVYHDL